MKHILTGICAVALTIGLGACDQRSERQSRAGDLFEAVVDQLEASETAGQASPLERASPAERAVSGSFTEAAAQAITADPSRIAVGSIIAKPRVVERMQRTVRAKRAPSPLSRLPGLTGEAETAPAPEADDTGIQANPPPPGIFGTPSIEDTVTEETLEPRVMEALITAQSDMFTEMDKLGLNGTVSSSSSGQLVIDMFADASQFSEDDPSQPLLAEDAAVRCPQTYDNELLKKDKLLATNCMIEILQASGKYEYVEKDYIFDHQFARRPLKDDKAFAVTPDDTLWQLQWHFQNNGSEPGQTAGGAGFVDFWTRQGITGAQDVTVAVVDTGLAMSHPDIANSPNIAPGWDMVTDPNMGNDGSGRDSDPNDPGDNCFPTRPGTRDSFHGTHVAGTIGAAATNNATGVAGGAWNVTIVPVRALGKCGGRLSDINDAIRWAGGIMPVEGPNGERVFNRNPADIINLSIGLFERCPASMQDAINAVVDRGAIVVAAAGNARLSTEFYAPGGCQNVITVAASDARGHITPYSNFGTNVDVLAPGGDLDRDDNADGRPDGVLSTRPSSNCYDPVTGDDIDTCNYAFEQGTSMAAPHVSAALALIKARSPEATASEIEATLISTLMPRDADQCTAACNLYRDATEIPDRPGVCMRACGGLLNLGNLPDRLNETGQPASGQP